MSDKIRTIENTEITWPEQRFDGDDAEPCACCGRKVSTKKGWFWSALVAGGGGLVVHGEDAGRVEEMIGEPKTDENRYLMDVMGYYPIGSECVKKVPKEYRTKFVIE